MFIGFNYDNGTATRTLVQLIRYFYLDSRFMRAIWNEIVLKSSFKNAHRDGVVIAERWGHKLTFRMVSSKSRDLTTTVQSMPLALTFKDDIYWNATLFILHKSLCNTIHYNTILTVNRLDSKFVKIYWGIRFIKHLCSHSALSTKGFLSNLSLFYLMSASRSMHSLNRSIHIFTRWSSAFSG